ncbi:MAG TPA: hypothetical protein VF654_13540, partial [Pyrinomonadaceae bacterium]
LAVCARCFGLYVGALAGVAAYPLARPLVRRDMPGRAWLLAAAVRRDRSAARPAKPLTPERSFSISQAKV